MSDDLMELLGLRYEGEASLGPVIANLEGAPMDELFAPPDPPKDLAEDPQWWTRKLFEFEPNSDPAVIEEALSNSPQKLLEFVVSRVRPREKMVFQCVLRKGYVTKDDCKAAGCDYVVIRDLRKVGVPFVRHLNKYYLDWPSSSVGEYHLQSLPPALRDQVIRDYGNRCAICLQVFESKELFPDHKIPRKIAGDDLLVEEGPLAFQACCYSCNNRKQQACRKCPNQVELKNPDNCRRCYWASPEDYDHVAMVEEMRADLVARGESQIVRLSRLLKAARRMGL